MRLAEHKIAAGTFGTINPELIDSVRNWDGHVVLHPMSFAPAPPPASINNDPRRPGQDRQPRACGSRISNPAIVRFAHASAHHQGRKKEGRKPVHCHERYPPGNAARAPGRAWFGRQPRRCLSAERPDLAAFGETLAAVCTAFTALGTDKAAAERCQAAMKTTASPALLRRGLLLVLHLTLRGVVALRWRLLTVGLARDRMLAVSV